ncbi:hypothetical protein FRC15_005280 [Serendipita sp. 397]|nr:hypothetical protein FRC15_005280 [Serendipita sp. 397]
MNTSERSSPSIIPNHTIGHPTLSPPNTLSAPPPPPSSQPPLRDHTPPAPPPAPAPGGLVYGEGGGPTAWWTPIQAKTDVSIGTKKARMHRSAPGSNRVNGVEDPGPEPAVSVEDRDGATTSIEIVPMSNRPRLRKVDDSGKLVWPFELEAVLIAGLRKYHATACRPRPSASRNVNRNKLVSEYIYNMTSLRRSTKQIASRIQVLRDAWKGTKQFALVAQPRELSEMGYLPSAEEFDEMADISSNPSLVPSYPIEGHGPVRNRRSTRRSTRMTNKGNEQIDVKTIDDIDTAMGNSFQHSPRTSLLFDLHQVDRFISFSNSSSTLSTPAMLLLECRRRRLRATKTIVVQCNLPFSMISFPRRRNSSSSQAPTSLSIPQLTMEICPSRLEEAVAALGEEESQRQLLGTKFSVLQNSLVYRNEEKCITKYAGVIEQELADRSDGTTKFRYPLPTQFITHEIFEDDCSPVIAVQNLSVLRATDSRHLDSLVVLWVFEPRLDGLDTSPSLQVSNLDHSTPYVSYGSSASSSQGTSTVAHPPNPLSGAHIVRDTQPYSPLSSHSSALTEEEHMDFLPSHDQGPMLAEEPQFTSSGESTGTPSEGLVEPSSSLYQVHPKEATSSFVQEQSWTRSSPSPIFSPQDRSNVEMVLSADQHSYPTSNSSPKELLQCNVDGVPQQQHRLGNSWNFPAVNDPQSWTTRHAPFLSQGCMSAYTALEPFPQDAPQLYHPSQTNQETYALRPAAFHERDIPVDYAEDPKRVYMDRHGTTDQSPGWTFYSPGSWTTRETYPQWIYLPQPYFAPMVNQWSQQPPPPQSVPPVMPLNNAQDGRMVYPHVIEYDTRAIYVHKEGQISREDPCGTGETSRTVSNHEHETTLSQSDTPGPGNTHRVPSWVSGSVSDTSSASPQSPIGPTSFASHVLDPGVVSPRATSSQPHADVCSVAMETPGDSTACGYPALTRQYIVEYPPADPSSFGTYPVRYASIANPTVYDIHN